MEEVFVRRQWNDWKIGKVNFSKLDGFRWDNISGGVFVISPQPFIHAYTSCENMVEKMFETSIPANTIIRRAERAKDKITTKVVNPPTPPIPSKIPEKPANQQVRNGAGAFVEGTCPGPGRPPKYQYPQEPWSCAMSMAGLAIGHLGRIPDDDPKRHEAFQKVITWINDHS